MKKMIIPSALALVLSLTACGEKQTDTAAHESNNPTEQRMETKTTGIAAAQMPADGDHTGKAIHDKSCMNCHDSGVYTRPDRKMTDYTMLSGQVRRCDANIGSKLFEEDMDKISDYLSDTYYKFAKP